MILASAGQVSGVPTLAKLAKSAVVVISIFMALQQVGVAEDIVTSAFTLILGAVALGVGLAFGLGNRELAGEITRRWYEEGQRRDRRKHRPARRQTRRPTTSRPFWTDPSGADKGKGDGNLRPPSSCNRRFSRCASSRRRNLPKWGDRATAPPAVNAPAMPIR